MTRPVDREHEPGEVTARLADAGYTARLEIVDGARVRCGACGRAHEPEDCAIEEMHRYEGESDPEDEETILALRCDCGHRGWLVAPPGAYASTAEAEVLRRLRDARA